MASSASAVTGSASALNSNSAASSSAGTISSTASSEKSLAKVNAIRDHILCFACEERLDHNSQVIRDFEEFKVHHNCFNGAKAKYVPINPSPVSLT